MNGRAKILAQFRRWRFGAGRFVVGAFAAAYLSAGVAPCIAAASRPAAGAAHTVRDLRGGSHEGHEHGGAVATAHHVHQTAADAPPARNHGDGSRGGHCPHCPGDAGGAPKHDDHSSCSMLDDLSNVAASQPKQVQEALAPLAGPPAFTLPPPLAPPNAAPPLRAERVPPLVPLNVRHCVFLI